MNRLGRNTQIIQTIQCSTFNSRSTFVTLIFCNFPHIFLETAFHPFAWLLYFCIFRYAAGLIWMTSTIATTVMWVSFVTLELDVYNVPIEPKHKYQMCTKFTLKGKSSFLSSLPGCILSTDKSEHSEQTPARKDNSTNGGQSPLRQVSKQPSFYLPCHICYIRRQEPFGQRCDAV